MEVLAKVSIEDFIHGFFTSDINLNLVFSQSIHDIDSSYLMGESANNISVVVVPPWNFKFCNFILNITICILWWDM